MIAKGTTHNNGLKLAQYITTGKDGERAELWKLVGFASPDIKQAFRCVHVMAEATKCEQPFFHVQVRNREGERLTLDQWETTAHRVMRINGLTGQPYAIAFHTNELTGDMHMHLAVSLIDAETMKAKRLPFFELRLKRVSRELEKEFGLEPVRNEREGLHKQAPTRGEYEQARRLGVSLDEIDNTIRTCWKHSDNGRSFRDALEHEGLILAEGDRRSSLVVIDYAGGVHALGKRILGVTPGQIKARTSDLDRDELPSVQEAKEFILENAHERQQPDKLDRLKSELAEVQKLQAEATAQQREKPAPVWDRDRDNAAWEKAVMNAAIEHEKVERRFVEPRQKETRGGREQAEVGGREKVWPINPPQPERKSPGLFGKAATEAGRDDRAENLHATGAAARPEARHRPMPENLKSAAAEIWTAYQQSQNPRAFAAALAEQGLRLAVVSTSDVMEQQRVDNLREELQRLSYMKERGVWMVQEGGVSALGAKQLRSAKISHEAYQDRKKQHENKLDFHTYVSYVQNTNAARIKSLTADARILDFADGGLENNHHRTPQHAAIRAVAGEFVVINEHGYLHRLDERTTGDKSAEVQKFLAPLDRKEFQSVADTRQTIRDERTAAKLERATDIIRGGRTRAGNIKDNLAKSPAAILKPVSMGLNLAGGALKILENVFEGVFAPKLTPEQIRDGEIAARERQADVRDEIDHSNAIAQRAQERQRREQEQAARDRERENERQL